MKKKLVPIIIFILAFAASFTYTGCDLNSFPINIPVIEKFYIHGSNSSISDSDGFCLDETEEFNDLNDINKLTYIAAAYYTDSLETDDLNIQGNITISLFDAGNSLLISVTKNNVKLRDYLNTPFVFDLDAAEIALMNAYLGNVVNKCFTATVTVSGITNAAPEYKIWGRVEMIIEAETEI